ncbi:hypothetical protein EJB05_26560, partial [Eragrostis curvula]
MGHGHIVRCKIWLVSASAKSHPTPRTISPSFTQLERRNLEERKIHATPHPPPPTDRTRSAAMQQQMAMPPGAAAAAAPPAAGITTEQIQKVRPCPFPARYLDENKQLILAILENQNLGKLAECAQYQAQLQKNLLYLAAIADAQPQPTQNPASRPPMMQPGMVPGAGHYMSQVPMFPPRTPLTPQQMQEQQLQQQQAQALSFPGQMVMRPASVNGMQPMQTADLQQSVPVPADGRGGKQDAAAGVSAEPSGTEGHKNATGADNEAGGDVAEKSQVQ